MLRQDILPGKLDLLKYWVCKHCKHTMFFFFLNEKKTVNLFNQITNTHTPCQGLFNNINCASPWTQESKIKKKKRKSEQTFHNFEAYYQVKLLYAG